MDVLLKKRSSYIYIQVLRGGSLRFKIVAYLTTISSSLVFALTPNLTPNLQLNPVFHHFINPNSYRNILQNGRANHTPLTKIQYASAMKHHDSAKSTQESSSSATTKTPPVEPSVSPEIQSSLYRSVHVSGAAPSTCYAAGHVISGVTDRRKCKARGILSAGRSKPPEHDIFEKTSPSLMIPFPTEASISWHLSPIYVDNNDNDDDDDDDDDDDGKGDYSKGLSSVSLHDTPQEERILSLDFNGECSPFSAEFLSSGNVMQTPNSDSSFEGVQLKYKFESELDQVKEKDVLEHERLTPKESQMRISWRDEVTFDKDDLDCCRLLSDEEIDENGLLKSPKFFEHHGKEKESLFPTRINPCEESVCTDDGGLTISVDSDWSLHYKKPVF
ncbi:unnamed protein product [Lactuca virosa]|uniref:Uncharacterized protein n=1 Tax=Lactuca virosa TaxID=75947 RepID=A0AAU9M332_9ASTR|nr:unnamed protein product [Lactuca virosa]